MNIYFICSGNTCRSPMAEALLRAKQLPHVEVRSAGLMTVDGLPMSDHAKTLVTKHDLPHTPFSHALTEEDIEWADLILTMTTSHEQMLHQLFPESKEKVMTLKRFVGEETFDVADPFGGSLEQYEATFHELQQLVDRLIERLQKEEEK